MSRLYYLFPSLKPKTEPSKDEKRLIADLDKKIKEHSLPNDFIKEIDKMFEYAFWHNKSREVISPLSTTFLFDYLLRIFKKPNAEAAASIMLISVELWRARGHIQFFDQKEVPPEKRTSLIQTTPAGNTFLVSNNPRMPPIYNAAMDLMKKPVSKIAWLIGLFSGALAIWQWLLPSH